MLIVSQDRRRITDDLNLCIIRDDDNFIIESTLYYLGKYESEERAKEVMQNLLDCFLMRDKTNVEFEENLVNLLARNNSVFYMPEK